MPDSRDKRRWQFSIKSLFIAVVLCSLGALLTTYPIRDFKIDPNAIIARLSGVRLMVASGGLVIGYGFGGWRTAVDWAAGGILFALICLLPVLLLLD